MQIPLNFNFGYACLNTALRKKNIFTSRTIRQSTFEKKGFEYVKTLIEQNLNDLLTILKWNVKNNIFFMRISSEIFPFRTHKNFSYDIKQFEYKLKEIGDFAKQFKIRLTMHPSQFNILTSNNDKIINNTILDLQHHCEILDLMRLDQNSVIIIHGGGVYGNKKQALINFKNNFLKLNNQTQNRIVLENCETCYTVEDLLPLCENLNIPLVIDYHHDEINPSSLPVRFYHDRVFKIWKNKNIKPKIHISNNIPDLPLNASMTMKRKHSDFITYFQSDILTITFPIDVMLECKKKEQSVLILNYIKKIESKNL